jgi:hypothetical protein
MSEHEAWVAAQGGARTGQDLCLESVVDDEEG